MIKKKVFSSYYLIFNTNLPIYFIINKKCKYERNVKCSEENQFE